MRGLPFLLLFLFPVAAISSPIVDIVRENVVEMHEPANARFVGTGFEVRTQSGHVVTVTNAHVCEDAVGGHMLIKQGRKYWDAAISKSSRERDLCILSGVPRKAGIPLGLDIQLKDDIVSAGHPEANPLWIEAGWVTGFTTLQWPCGKMPCTAREIPSVILNTLSLPGSSGSPIVNFKGELVAVVYATDGHHAFALPISSVLEMLKGF